MPNTSFISTWPGSANHMHLSWILDQKLVSERTIIVKKQQKSEKGKAGVKTLYIWYTSKN